VRPAQSSQILPTRPLVGEPRPELLIGPRIVTPADRTGIASHDQQATSLKQICRTPDLFHAMPVGVGAAVRFNGWRESMTVQVSRPFDWVVVAHLANVPLSGRPFRAENGAVAVR
jgi:hypothetical protein